MDWIGRPPCQLGHGSVLLGKQLGEVVEEGGSRSHLENGVSQVMGRIKMIKMMIKGINKTTITMMISP